MRKSKVGGLGMEKLNVAIADDNERMLNLLSNIVKSDEELHVIGTAKDGEEAYRMIKDKSPDVVLLDIVMPKLDGLGVLDKVNQDQTGNPAQADLAGDFAGCLLVYAVQKRIFTRTAQYMHNGFARRMASY